MFVITGGGKLVRYTVITRNTFSDGSVRETPCFVYTQGNHMEGHVVVFRTRLAAELFAKDQRRIDHSLDEKDVHHFVVETTRMPPPPRKGKRCAASVVEKFESQAADLRARRLLSPLKVVCASSRMIDKAVEAFREAATKLPRGW